MKKKKKGFLLLGYINYNTQYNSSMQEDGGGRRRRRLADVTRFNYYYSKKWIIIGYVHMSRLRCCFSSDDLNFSRSTVLLLLLDRREGFTVLTHLA